MPQGRKKVPFSGKAKKEQLKTKKQSRNSEATTSRKTFIIHKSDSDESSQTEIQKINEQPHKQNKTNRYALKFHKDTAEDLIRQKEAARNEIVPVSSEKELEVVEDYFPKEFDFPKRPEWSYEMSKESLDSTENRYFTEYLNKLEEKFEWKSMSFFELNLETWRQLWRVLEMSDIVLFIVDIRFAGIMFPPSLYDHVVNECGKEMIIVLNKIDLAPPELVAAWKVHFEEKYPRLHVIMFTTLPGYNLRGNVSNTSGLLNRRRKGRLRMAAEGTRMLLDACKEIVKDQVDLSLWQTKIAEETMSDHDEEFVPTVGKTITQTNDTSFYKHQSYKNGVLTIGCVGQPNVGKSSLMNAVMGKKVVSVSKTPGHTKHFQTIFLTENVCLCDCPGLVFPSKVPKALQVLSGCYPIAQLRDPYTTLRYVAERIDLPRLLNMAHPEKDDSWSAIDVCDGWAKKRGFYTAKAARLDSYRAANSLLRMCLDGKICLRLYPPGFVDKRGEYKKHPLIKTVQWIQALSEEQQETLHETDSSESESNDGNESSSESSDEISTDAQTNKFSVLGLDD